MLQNRIDPFGNLIKTRARGAWMGNRGLLHNHEQQIVRPYKLKAWITCLLQFKERKRQVMAPDKYTELFFLDEATAFAAGHRPCAECRRKDFDRFKAAWLKGNPQYGFKPSVSIQLIDEILHAERISHGAKVTYEAALEELTDGCFIVWQQQPFLIIKNEMYLWTPGGYGQKQPLPQADIFTVLTPKSIVQAFKQGYEPQIAFA